MTQIFISYKSEYRPLARRVRDRLRDWGYNTWFDHEDIPSGSYFRHEIQQGLENSEIVIGEVQSLLQIRSADACHIEDLRVWVWRGLRLKFGSLKIGAWLTVFWLRRW